MIYKSIKNEKISQFCIGGGTLNPNKDPDLKSKEAKEILKFLINNGANIIDTGKDYNERFLAESLDNLKNKVKIASKSESFESEEIKKDVLETLKIFEKDSIFLFQMHMVNSLTDFIQRLKNNVLNELLKLKNEGKIRNIGIFSHKIKVLEEAIKSGCFDVVTTIYNPGHRMAEQLFPLLDRYNTNFIAAAPFSNGVLIDPNFDNKRNIKELTPEKSLKFILSNKNISSVMVGSRTLEEAKENIKSGRMEWNLTEAERNSIENEYIEKLGKNFCRGCRYCEPCTEWDELIISELLKLKLYYQKYKYKDFSKWQYSMTPQGKNTKLCTNCGDCLKRCPYDIEINKELKKAHSLLS